ncbi:MAG: TonB-dependent receptor plug domain-containing protein, partial [Sphingobacterium sp.]
MTIRSALTRALILASSFGYAAATNASTAFVGTTWAQSQVQGTIRDADGPISGASIRIQGTGVSTFSDENGRFTLSNIKEEATIIVSFVGYRSQEIKFQGQAELNVTLESDVADLDEVVVVAYGTAKKSTFTGSASVVKGEQIEKISGTGFAEALQGASAGVNVTNNEGNPGGDTRIQIRGISSMSGSSNPLYVVDGMPFDGQLNSIAQNDIESITVLKDAAASSLYGSRAANGVVVITTKKGTSAKPQINLRSSWGTSDNAVANPVKADPYNQLLNTWEGI